MPQINNAGGFVDVKGIRWSVHPGRLQAYNDAIVKIEKISKLTYRKNNKAVYPVKSAASF